MTAKQNPSKLLLYCENELKKSLGPVVIVHIFNPSPMKTEARGFLRLWPF